MMTEGDTNNLIVCVVDKQLIGKKVEQVISREKLIEAIKQDVIITTEEGLDLIGEIIDLIKEQPQAEKWIPCEERLPNKHDDYIVTYKEIRGEQVRCYTSEAWFEPQTKEWYGNVSIPNLEREVIAWQERPRPYERMTEREGRCAFEEQFPRGDAYICKKTALICTAEKLKYCKHKQPYKKEGAESE